ncbi:hypothetical protein NDU88_003756 [Pleurodeles waltl]|uniref:Uncharacterized protein n=1 Tax=Pleurodeles waltl TaxID=8319 RepID=A0AAV7WVQ4_PLEWA|nr:hypothetical protein NDU88_003756 [Pleurodeles waltl]
MAYWWSLQPWRTVLKLRKYRKQAGGQKKGIMTLAETANKDSHYNTPPATAVQTSSAAVTANRQAEDNVPPTVLQSATFSGADSPWIKTRRKQLLLWENAHLNTSHEERGLHGAGTPNTPCPCVSALLRPTAM